MWAWEACSYILDKAKAFLGSAQGKERSRQKFDLAQHSAVVDALAAF
jgi:hypothetical protein